MNTLTFKPVIAKGLSEVPLMETGPGIATLALLVGLVTTHARAVTGVGVGAVVGVGVGTGAVPDRSLT